MKQIYWIEEGVLAGRCGPWREPFDMEAMAAGGITAILSLDRNEHDLIVGTTGPIEHGLIHLPDSIPPAPHDIETYRTRVPEAVDFIADRVDRGNGAVLVHCHAGNDRTGTILAAWLVRTRDAGPDEALEMVRRQNPDAVSAWGYEEMALDILGEIAG